jgi:hypothetical protein
MRPARVQIPPPALLMLSCGYNNRTCNGIWQDRSTSKRPGAKRNGRPKEIARRSAEPSTGPNGQARLITIVSVLRETSVVDECSRKTTLRNVLARACSCHSLQSFPGFCWPARRGPKSPSRRADTCAQRADRSVLSCNSLPVLGPADALTPFLRHWSLK